MALLLSSSKRTLNSFPLSLTTTPTLRFLNKTPLPPVSRDATATAMSSLHRVTKAITTSTSTLVTKLLTSTYPTRLISSPFYTDSVTAKLKAMRVMYPRMYPFQIEGKGSPFCVEQREEALYVRVDVPGATKEGLKVCVENDCIHFDAQEKWKHGREFGVYEMPRTFKGYVPFFPHLKYKTDQIKALLSNGVLKIVLPTLSDDH